MGFGGIWLEDESQRIGWVNIPNPLWKQMREAKVFYLDIPFEERLKNITENYGTFDSEKLKAATLRIQKRLGGLDTKNAIHYFEEGKIYEAFSILLKYYDKFYSKATAERKKETIEMIPAEKISPFLNAAKITRTVASVH